MRRVMIWLALLVAPYAVGCGEAGLTFDGSTRKPRLEHVTMRPDATTPVAGDVEVFEGKIELFGAVLRARREVKLNEHGNYVKHGHAMAWYESGQKAGEMWFENDLPNGPIRIWHENGFKRQRGQSKNGLAYGRWNEWYDNGGKQSDGEYLNGERQGVWTFWDEQGRMVASDEYRQGERIRSMTNGENGLMR